MDQTSDNRLLHCDGRALASPFARGDLWKIIMSFERTPSASEANRFGRQPKPLERVLLANWRPRSGSYLLIYSKSPKILRFDWSGRADLMSYVLGPRAHLARRGAGPNPILMACCCWRARLWPSERRRRAG